jgi:hypothetical protein
MHWRGLWNDRPRWQRRTVYSLLGVLLAIPLLTNIVLWLRIVPWLLNADSAALNYDAAWAPWPTRIKLEGLLVKGRDSNVEFAIHIDEAWLTLDLWSAVSARTIKITRVRGSGVSVRALQRIDPEQVTDEKVNALPDIPGYPKPPVTEAYVPGPPATREHYDQISVDVSGIDATAKELWIDEARYRGRMHVVGGFLLRPGLELHIAPDAAVTIESGKLEIAGAPVLTDLRGRAHAETPYFNPCEPKDLAILAFFSGSLVLRGNLPNTEFARYFLKHSGVELHGGSGSVELDVVFVRGIVQPGTSIALSSRALRAKVAHTNIDATLLLKASVADSKLGSLQLRASELSIAPDKARARMSGGELTADVDTLESVDLSRLPPAANYRAALTPLSGDIAVLGAYLPKDLPLSLDDGHLSVSGDVAGRLGKPEMEGKVELKSAVVAHAGSRRFAGNVALRGVARRRCEQVALGGTSVDVSDLMVAEGKDVTYGWWTHAEIASGEYTQGKSGRLELELRGGLRDIEPLFVAYGKDIGIPTWVQRLLPLPKTSWHGHLSTEDGAVAVENFRATNGSVTARLKLRKPNDRDPTGAIQLVSGPLSFGIAFGAGETHTKIMATDAWFDEQR